MLPLSNDAASHMLHLLQAAPAGLTVEHLRSQLAASGLPAGKAEIVRTLRELGHHGHVRFDRSRRWQLQHLPPSMDQPQGGEVSAFSAIDCTAMSGSDAAVNPLPDTDLKPDADLLRRLLPYYQEALRLADGGSSPIPLESHGDHFVLLRPDARWWPTEDAERRLRVARSMLPASLAAALAKANGGELLLGYPIYLVTPRGDDSQTFLRPVTTFRCRFELDDLHLDIRIPPRPPAVSTDWLHNRQRYGRWEPARLRSWLMLEQDGDDVRDDDEVDIPDFLDMPQLTSRIALAVASETRQRLDPARLDSAIPGDAAAGYHNVLALMTDQSRRFTRSAIRDYDRLQKVDPAAFAATALDPLFGGAGHERVPPPLIHPFPLGEAQLLAARKALGAPLTVITGPPGTGKSQVIAAIMLSAAAAGRSVLLAARQHRALDAVQERLEALSGDRVPLMRASEAEGAGGMRFSDALKALQVRSPDEVSASSFENRYERLGALDRRRNAALRTLADLKQLRLEASALADRIETIEQETDTDSPDIDGSEDVSTGDGIAALVAWAWRPISMLPGLRTLVRALKRHRRRITLRRLRADLAACLHEIDGREADAADRRDDPIGLSEAIAKESEDILPPLFDSLDRLDEEDRRTLIDLAGDSSLMGKSLPSEASRLILKHMPLWAVTTLAAGSRIPIEAGLFDYVIFDEAAQTDIASALPLLCRARSAVIVGDPMQLSMIAGLTPKEERDLLQRHDLLRAGIGRYAQGRTTLFDLASACAGDARITLNEHYRCHPDIAAYFNEAFYGRKLAALTDKRRLRVPRGFRAGLDWIDVDGPISSRKGGRGGSAASEDEARAVTGHLKALLESDFEGTIGVVTFFDFQAKLIGEMAAKEIGAAAIEKNAVKVFTANRFQGDERDVMLLSLCLGPDMPQGARHFLAKERRLLNVAVSRARAMCVVVGNADHAARSGIPHIEALVRKVRQQAKRDDGRADDRFDSPWERKLHEALVRRGLSPIPQHPVGGRFLDLALVDETRNPPKHIDIEVDGVAFHTDAGGERLATDLWRDHQLRGLGWNVLRFWVYELQNDMEACVDRIQAEYRR